MESARWQHVNPKYEGQPKKAISLSAVAVLRMAVKEKLYARFEFRAG